MTAMNPLGNKTVFYKDPFYVQVPPSMPVLDQRMYSVVFGYPITFTASVSQGTNVSYFWKAEDRLEKIKGGTHHIDEYAFCFHSLSLANLILHCVGGGRRITM